MQNEHTPMGEGTATAVDAVVEKAQEHAKTIHNMELSREQALSMARQA